MSKEINRSNSWRYDYYPLASEECRVVLLDLGYNKFKINGERGSHSATVYVWDEDRKKFEEEIVGNIIIGKYRKFYFSRSFNYFGHWNYIVSYKKL